MSGSKMTDSEMVATWFDGTLWKNLWTFQFWPLVNHKEDIADKLKAKYEGDAVEVYD